MSVRLRPAKQLGPVSGLMLLCAWDLRPTMKIAIDARNVTNHHFAQRGLSLNAVPKETLRGVLGARVSF